MEFVINMHDYNKLLRHPNSTLRWGTRKTEKKEKIAGKKQETDKHAAAQEAEQNGGGLREGAEVVVAKNKNKEGENEGGGSLEALEALDAEEDVQDGYGFGGGYFDEHLAPWPGYDWSLSRSLRPQTLGA